MAADMFTPDEAFRFLDEKLHVQNARERTLSDRKNLLDDFIVAIQSELPYQNIRLLSDAPEKRRRPTMEEMKADVVSGVGGICYTINIAAYFLLKAIGFDVLLLRSKCLSSIPRPANHVIIHVKNVETPGDLFLVDTGLGFPTFRAINLDFENESPAYRDSFHEYKYIRHDGKIVRMHKHGEEGPRSNLHDGEHFIMGCWHRFYFSETDGTTDLSEFDSDFDAVFTNPNLTHQHKNLKVLSFPGKRAVMIANEKTLIENDSGDLVPIVIPGGDEGIRAEVKRLFPVFREADINQAIFNWRRQTSQRV